MLRLDPEDSRPLLWLRCFLWSVAVIVGFATPPQGGFRPLLHADQGAAYVAGDHGWMATQQAWSTRCLSVVMELLPGMLRAFVTDWNLITSAAPSSVRRVRERVAHAEEPSWPTTRDVSRPCVELVQGVLCRAGL
ncbi:hypothetical protein GCM10017691_19690 [Pseudonocardia petroleophila]